MYEKMAQKCSRLTKPLLAMEHRYSKEDDAFLAQKNELRETPKIEEEAPNTQ